jgi:uncharacterized UBP type Zn finger protein
MPPVAWSRGRRSRKRCFGPSRLGPARLAEGAWKTRPVRCSHLALISDVTPNSRRCEACVAVGSSWVHLRMCLLCGLVGCCDSSPNRHAAAHAAAEVHPVARSVEPGESWRWCYVDEEFV